MLSDLLISEGTFSVPPGDIDMFPPIERGKLIREANGDGGPYNRYLDDRGRHFAATPVPGVPGHVHVVATDEHDEEGILISDEFTNPIKRRQMVEKRAASSATSSPASPPPNSRATRTQKSPWWAGVPPGASSARR